jgi:WD40 repeat protein
LFLSKESSKLIRDCMNGTRFLMSPLLTHICVEPTHIQCTVYCAASCLLITVGRDGAVSAWSLERGERVGQLDGHIGDVRCARVHENTFVSFTALHMTLQTRHRWRGSHDSRMELAHVRLRARDRYTGNCLEHCV